MSKCLLKIIYNRIKSIFVETVEDINAFFSIKNKDLDEIAVNISDIKRLYTVEKYVQNDYYGNATIMKKYAGISRFCRLKNVIQHGTYYGDFVWKKDVNNNSKYILVQGHNRKELYNNIGKHVLVTGTHIAYAEAYYSPEKTSEIHKKNGKTLLVFPSHSTHHNTVEFDINCFIEEIKKISQDFNTVIVCMYWKDLLLKREESFIEQGWQVVTAGHIYDKHFLCRLRTVFELGDAMITNGVGDHIGQAVFFDLPVYFFKQDLTLVHDDVGEHSEGSEVKYLEDLFSVYRDKITNKQYEVCDFIFGSKTKISKAQMKEILLKR